ncbi:N-methyl-L-tryptophan oxidase [Prauserella flavalba]|uniref:N-methyltryptophan oxidase n=1 Tax=Prauserella flavalba TaxID=1477506 RepID=A0A318LKV2_9PSEU|nr:N-methyl-L-tryptophan oxidase [Prauserella flavalba]PXY33796.1 N-methyltryptophan oxidase [Prauserella flavalba]
MTAYDVIVIGLGGMGSAAAFRLAERGQRVLGLERHEPVHTKGSSHGGSRITRQAYFEDPAYVPLLLRAHELWPRLEADAGLPIFTRCGGLMVGGPESRTVAGSVRSAEKWGLAHEILTAAEIRERFPTMRPAEGDIGLYEPGAGFVVPEASVTAHLRLAERAGADLRFTEPVLSWRDDGDGVRVTTPLGEYTAGRLVVCPGAWAPGLLADLGVTFTVERQVQYWFAPAGGAEPFAPERHPVYIWENEHGRQCYGFPAVDGEAKVAFFRGGLTCTPETIDRTVHPHEVDEMAAFAGARLPSLPGEFRRAATCMYTNTPDEHFVIARHPAHDNVVVACGFSGHGFKFVPVVGEVVADLVTDGATEHPIALFDPARLAGSRGAA